MRSTRLLQTPLLPRFPPLLVDLGVGLLHLVTSVFEEVHTPNATVCVHGTTVLVHVTSPPDTTEVINLVGSATVWKQGSNRDERERFELQSNQRVLVRGPERDAVFAPEHTDVVLLAPRRNEQPVGEYGCQPNACDITPDTKPPLSILDLEIVIPRQ